MQAWAPAKFLVVRFELGPLWDRSVGGRESELGLWVGQAWARKGALAGAFQKARLAVKEAQV